MRLWSYEFKPSLVPTIAFLIVLPILIKMGLWQMERAEFKRNMIEQQETGRDQGFQFALSEELDRLDRLDYRPVHVTGAYQSNITWLIDNQLRNGQAGYLVVTPFLLDDSRHVVPVVRGWVSSRGSREYIPEVTLKDDRIKRISGELRPMPRAGMVLEMTVEPMAEGLDRVPELTVDEISGRVEAKVISKAVYLDPEEPHGFLRDWGEPPRMGPEKHIGYAVQWFAMALTLVIIYLVLTIKRVSN